jgi:hypothetical protein
MGYLGTHSSQYALQTGLAHPNPLYSSLTHPQQSKPTQTFVKTEHDEHKTIQKSKPEEVEKPPVKKSEPRSDEPPKPKKVDERKNY